MKIDDFIKLLKYKPKYVTDPCKWDDDIRIIEFRNHKRWAASIEFGTKYRKKEKGCYFYFEVLDLSGYKDGDVIPISSNMRHDVVFCWPSTDEHYKKLATHVNEALKKMHKQ